MLNEIRCDKFIESPIVFKEGLNIVLGDEFSTNSIGKSSLLMIVDFVFGGNSYISKNSGSIKEIGDHSFRFYFTFKNKYFYFSRTTDRPETVFECDNNFKIINEIKISEYTEFLLRSYDLDGLKLSFRSVVSLYSRIWGKENNNVDKPLQSALKEPESTGVSNLIKLFELYSKVEETILNIKQNEESKKVINGLFRQNFVRKIRKREYEENIRKIESIEKNINDIQDNLLQYTLNIEELASEEIINLKTKKYQLLDSQALIKNKIQRIELNLQGSGNIKSKHLERLVEFFDNPNLQKINEIENFHAKISKILRRELELSRDVLIEENKIIQNQINDIDEKISSLLEGVKSPKFIVEKVYDMTININKIKEVNDYYEEKKTIDSNIREFNETLDDTLNDILSYLERTINENLETINSEVYSEDKKSPKIRLKRKSYTYDHSDNTGTGKSYIDLIIFDLTILELTKLPIVIHDSFMFKNIEDESVDKILKKYSNFKKQIFISIDGISKYKKSKELIEENTVIELSDSKLLFNKDWR